MYAVRGEFPRCSVEATDDIPCIMREFFFVGYIMSDLRVFLKASKFSLVRKHGFYSKSTKIRRMLKKFRTLEFFST